MPKKSRAKIRFEETLRALFAVPKAEIDEAEAKRPKRSYPKPRKRKSSK